MNEAGPASFPLKERASLSDWLAVTAGMLGSLMALVDVSIVNASLPVIQGEIGATSSEGTWVGTSYLIAEIVIIPLTGWLERLFGMRRLLIGASLLFTLFSMVCGLAISLETLILGRIGQGLAGGILIPTAMSLVARRLPPSQQAIGLAMVAMTALLGPATGPVVGGWLTDTFSWRFIFFLNVPVCTAQVLLLAIAVHKDKGSLQELRNADWLGIFGMMIGLGSMTMLLEEGHREQWFDSALIWKLAIASVIGFAMIATGQMRSDRPVIRLSMLRNPSLASAAALMIVVGLLLFTSIFVTPQFLAAVAGYSALQAGEVVFISGVVSIPVAFAYPLVVKFLDTRVIVGVAILLIASANLLVVDLTPQSVGSAFVLSQLVCGTGVTLSAMPLQQVAFSSVSPEDATEANAIMSVARNLGGSIGLAAIASFQVQRFELHRWQLNGAVAANDPEVQRQIAETSAMFGGGPEGLEAAYRAMDGQAMVQAMVMMFNDMFLVLGVVGLIMLPAVLFLRPVAPGSAMGMAH